MAPGAVLTSVALVAVALSGCASPPVDKETDVNCLAPDGVEHRVEMHCDNQGQGAVVLHCVDNAACEAALAIAFGVEGKTSTGCNGYLPTDDPEKLKFSWVMEADQPPGAAAGCLNVTGVPQEDIKKAFCDNKMSFTEASVKKCYGLDRVVV